MERLADPQTSLSQYEMRKVYRVPQNTIEELATQEELALDHDNAALNPNPPLDHFQQNVLNQIVKAESEKARGESQMEDHLQQEAAESILKKLQEGMGKWNSARKPDSKRKAG